MSQILAVESPDPVARRSATFGFHAQGWTGAECPFNAIAAPGCKMFVGSGLSDFDDAARRDDIVGGFDASLEASRVGVVALFPEEECEFELVLSIVAGDVERGLCFDEVTALSRELLAFFVAKTGDVDRLAEGSGSFFWNDSGNAFEVAVAAVAIARANVLFVEMGCSASVATDGAAAASLSLLVGADFAELAASFSAISLSPWSSIALPLPFLLFEAVSSFDLVEVTLIASSVLFWLAVVGDLAVFCFFAGCC